MKDDSFGISAIVVEPTAEMREAGLVMRQMFVGYTQAGFSEVQAMQLILQLMSNGSK